MNKDTATYHLAMLCFSLPTSMFLVVGTIYIVNVANLGAFLAGMYVNISTLLGIFINIFMRHRIDSMNKSLLIPAILAVQFIGAICVGASSLSGYLLIPAGLCAGIAQLIFPALFSYHHQHGIGGGASGNILAMRLIMSLSWIIGPPLSFLLFWLGGFTLVLAGMAVLIGPGCYRLFRWRTEIRKAETPVASSKSAETQNAKEGPTFSLIFIVMMSITSANSLHSIVLPFYLLNTLQAPVYFPGLAIGFAATAEVLVIIMMQKYQGLLDDEVAVWAGLALGFVYFAIVSLSRDVFIILASQALYGLHFALSTSACLPLLRRALQGGVGNVAAQFVNGIKLGALVGSWIFAVGAEPLGYFSLLSWGNLLLLSIGLFGGLWRYSEARAGRHPVGQATSTSNDG